MEDIIVNRRLRKVHKNYVAGLKKSLKEITVKSLKQRKEDLDWYEMQLKLEKENWEFHIKRQRELGAVVVYASEDHGNFAHLRQHINILEMMIAQEEERLELLDG